MNAIAAASLRCRVAPRGVVLAARQLSSWGIGARVLTTVDCHAAGEPARVVVGGMPHVPGATMYEKRAYIMEHLDGIRKLLLLEPRGYVTSSASK